jgi:hypothetical protein
MKKFIKRIVLIPLQIILMNFECGYWFITGEMIPWGRFNFMQKVSNWYKS